MVIVYENNVCCSIDAWGGKGCELLWLLLTVLLANMGKLGGVSIVAKLCS